MPNLTFPFFKVLIMTYKVFSVFLQLTASRLGSYLGITHLTLKKAFVVSL